MIYITTPKNGLPGHRDSRQSNVFSTLTGQEMHEELCEFLGRIGISSGQTMAYIRQWNQHAKIPESKYNEALAAGATHATSEDIARIFYAKRPSGQEKSKKKPIKVKEIEHDGANGATTDCGPSDN